MPVHLFTIPSGQDLPEVGGLPEGYPFIHEGVLHALMGGTFVPVGGAGGIAIGEKPSDGLWVETTSETTIAAEHWDDPMRVVCFNPDGTEKWDHVFAADYWCEGVTTAVGMVLAAYTDDFYEETYLLALDAGTGAELWEAGPFGASYPVALASTSDGGVTVVIDDDRVAYAFDRDGNALWSSDLSAELADVFWRPQGRIGSQMFFLGDTNPALESMPVYSLDMENGTLNEPMNIEGGLIQRWWVDPGGAIVSKQDLDSPNDNFVERYDLQGGAPQWTHDFGFTANGVEVVSDQTHSIVSTNALNTTHTVWCFDSETGSPVWDTELSSSGDNVVHLALDGDAVFVLTEASMYWLDRQTGDQIDSAAHSLGDLYVGFARMQGLLTAPKRLRVLMGGEWLTVP